MVCSMNNIDEGTLNFDTLNWMLFVLFCAVHTVYLILRMSQCTLCMLDSFFVLHLSTSVQTIVCCVCIVQCEKCVDECDTLTRGVVYLLCI